MHCPLCQSEYPAGVSQCEGCRVALVEASHGAGAERVELWSGEDRRRFDELLAALEAADIPSYGEERPSGGGGAGFRVVPERPGLECAVWVLDRDARRAEEVVQALEQAEQARDPDVEEGGGK